MRGNRGISSWLKALIGIAIIFIFLLIADMICYFRFHFDPLDNLRHKGNAYTSVNDIAEELTGMIMDRKDRDVTFYVKDIDLNELKYVNYYMNTIDGTITGFDVFPSVFGIRQVRFNINRSDNSYVYDAYVNHTPIPEDRPMAELLYKKVCDILDSVLHEDMTIYSKELAIHDYIVTHCIYSTGSEDNNNEFRAYGALVEGKAVCNGYAEAMSLLLSCAGIENRYVIGVAEQPYSLQQQTMNTNDSDGHLENHAWNQVCINNKWYNVDATWDDPDFGTSVLSHRFFNVSDEILRADHEWHEEKAEKCSDMDWNYFEKKNLYAKNPEARQTVIKQMAAGHPYGYLECAFSGADLSEDEIGVLFSLSGISKLSYVISGEGQYKLLQVLIN